MKKCIIIAGSTASGKTALAVRLAQKFNTAVISADSRQCYRELSIGVARPTEQELLSVPHYFIATHSIYQKLTAADFEQYALHTINQLFEQHDVVVMAGGTGLYIKAFCEGLDDIPEVDEQIRNQIIQSYQAYGIDWLQQQLHSLDPLFAETGEMLNPQRMMRALEVVKATGKSIFSFRQQIKKQKDFIIDKYLLLPERTVLYNNINARVDNMMKIGLLDEVESLLPCKSLNALQTVGYTELFDYLEGKITLKAAVEEIKKNTRHYAKRQITWFKKQIGFTHIAVENDDALSFFVQ